MREVSCHDGAADVWVAETTVVLHRPARKNVKDVRYNRPGRPLELRYVVAQLRDEGGAVLAEWKLLSNVPRGWATAETLAFWYYWRWRIEIFFRVLKSGCRVESRRFERADRLLPCVAVYLIVAWRTLYVCRLGRSRPGISCEAVFEPQEWRSVYQVVTREKPPERPPRLQEMVRLVARLGGYVNRKGEDEPGPQPVWLGLQRLHDIALCWQEFGPGTPEKRSAAGAGGNLV